MADKTYEIPVSATVYLYHTIKIRLPEGLTEDEVTKRIDDAVGSFDWSDHLAYADADTEAGALHPPYPYAPKPPPQPDPVPDDAWIEWRGRRWATDNDMLVRDDCPTVVHFRDDVEWRTPNSYYGRPSPDDLDRLFPSPTTPPASTGAAPLVDLLAEPLVRAAAAVAWGGARDPIWLLDSSGAMQAIVMPLNRAMADPGAGEDLDVMFNRTREVPS